ncbi:MAG: hypothetical protein H6732_18470 [Alphaproteobacteria bacterium]|nr:hypothetical protein [Alphaproteobacteria bacterium]
MRRWWLAVGGIVLGIVGGTAAFALRAPAPPPPGGFVAQTFEELDPSAVWVRLEGTAHYEARLTQREPASLLAPERTRYVFGFFPVNDTSDREIPVLVRTSRPPERLVSFETMTVEGHLHPITRRDLPPEAETMFGERSGYFFADRVLLLDAVRVVSEDGTFEEP